MKKRMYRYIIRNLYPQKEFAHFIVDLIRKNNFDNIRNIADIPCGTGTTSYWIGRKLKNSFIFAADINSDKIEIAKENCARSNVSFCVANINDFVQEQSSNYDAICIINSLFLLSDPFEFLGRLNKNINHGTHLFLVIPNIQSQNYKFFSKMHPKINTVEWSIEKTLENLEKNNFKVVVQKGIIFVPYYKLQLHLSFLSFFIYRFFDYIKRMFYHEPQYYLIWSVKNK